MNLNDYAEYDQLMSMLLDGSLSPEQKRSLQNRLESDHGFRQFYLEYIEVHILLRGELEGRRLEGLPADIEGIQPTKPDESCMTDALGDTDGRKTARQDQPTDRRKEPSQRAPLPYAFRLQGVTRHLSIAAGLLIVAATLFWVVQKYNAQGPTLAHVTDSHDAYWEAATDGPGTNPDTLPSGEYDLRVGQLELTFTDGTLATLDAPANFTLYSEDHLHLTRGRVYVIAKEGTSGFRVSTPNALAIDLGTEFGVASDLGSATQVHVFKGAVNISEAKFDGHGNPTPSGEALKLIERQAGKVTLGTGPVRDQSADMSLFVRSISSLADAQDQAPTLQSWHAYRDRLRTDPTLAAAYDFTRTSRPSKSLTNIAYSTGNRLNGVLGDASRPDTAPRWTRGRFPGSNALLFNPTDKQYVGLLADDALAITGDLTTVWWMMPRSTIHRDFSMVVLGYGGPRGDHTPETSHENHMYAHGLKLGRIRAFHEAGPGNNQEALASPVIKPEAWTHVAIVRDTSAKRYHVYINGELTDSLSYKHNADGGDSPESFAAIGRSGGAKLNHFDGKLDELMIYTRALTEMEIKDLYQRSRPDIQ